MSRRNLEVTLIEYESMLHDANQRVGRAVRNMHQEMGGYGSKTPGSGEPGSGKNARTTVSIDDEQVPTTSVEIQALGFVGRDQAKAKRAELARAAIGVCTGLDRAGFVGCVRLGPDLHAGARISEAVALGYAKVRRLQENLPAELAARDLIRNQLDGIDADVDRVFHICQNWGYDPKRPHVPKARAELLAVDTTERWCTSHLRVGVKRERDPGRGELCQWCSKFQAAEGFMPPIELVQLHTDHGRVYEHQVAKHRQAHRDRQRNLTKVGS